MSKCFLVQIFVCLQTPFPLQKQPENHVICSRCLVVQHEARYSVDQALADVWISDKQCTIDIAKLEEEANITSNPISNVSK